MQRRKSCRAALLYMCFRVCVCVHLLAFSRPVCACVFSFCFYCAHVARSFFFLRERHFKSYFSAALLLARMVRGAGNKYSECVCAVQTRPDGIGANMRLMVRSADPPNWNMCPCVCHTLHQLSYTTQLHCAADRLHHFAWMRCMCACKYLSLLYCSFLTPQMAILPHFACILCVFIHTVYAKEFILANNIMVFFCRSQELPNWLLYNKRSGFFFYFSMRKNFILWDVQIADF